MGHLPLPTSWLPEFTRGIQDDSSVNGKLRQKNGGIPPLCMGLNSQDWFDATNRGDSSKAEFTHRYGHLPKGNRAGTPKIHLPEVDLQDLCCAMRNFEGSLLCRRSIGCQLREGHTPGGHQPQKCLTCQLPFFWIHPQDQTIQLWPLSNQGFPSLPQLV